MIIDATFWVSISFFIFLGILIYFKIPQKVISALDGSINSIKNEIDDAESLKEESKNILSEYEKKISNAKDEVKQMIAAATDDATRRAEQIAKNANADLGGLKSAKMGIFQIIGQNSNEDYSWGGTFNTSSKEKTATITMKLEFGIDR